MHCNRYRSRHFCVVGLILDTLIATPILQNYALGPMHITSVHGTSGFGLLTSLVFLGNSQLGRVPKGEPSGITAADFYSPDAHVVTQPTASKH